MLELLLAALLAGGEMPVERPRPVVNASCAGELTCEEPALAVAAAERRARVLDDMAADSQPSDADVGEPEKTGAEWYVQWGYNTESYASTNIKCSQPRKGNAFSLRGVRMRDAKDWDIWNHAPTVPQYSFRVGRFIRPNTAIEFNYDHAKAMVVPDQNVRLVGALNGRAVDETVRAGDVVSRYQLNNGANFHLVNAVQRFRLVGVLGETGSIAALAKAGAGFMIPHPEITVFGEPNERSFQFGGLGTGLEGAIRVRILEHIFLEAAQKVFYGRYRDLDIAGGTASQSVRAFVTILSLGVTW